MSNQSYSLDLNFLAVTDGLPEFTVYVKPRVDDAEARPFESARLYTLPIDPDNEERQRFWTSSLKVDGFMARVVRPSENVQLARRALFDALYSAATALGVNAVAETGFHEHLEIVMETYPEGWDLFILEPYFLKSGQMYGLIADFHFRKKPVVPFSRQVQQRSLSLNRNFRRNVDFYADKASRIHTYVKRHAELLGSVVMPGCAKPLVFNTAFESTDAFELRPRIYTFAGGKEGQAQFPGVRDIGPYAAVPSPPPIVFAFTADARQSAVNLANALTGIKRIGGYNGFQALFRCELTIDKKAQILESFEDDEIQKCIVRAQSDDPSPLTVVIAPDKDRARYLRIKSAFTNAGLLSQYCTIPLISSDEELKWSIANIGLQLFCKMGGQPWRIRPTSSDGMIVGISQSHKYKEGHGIERFFAFSVLTDSSGVFRKIRVLAEGPDHSNYIKQLSDSLSEELVEAAETCRNVVVHASFRLKRDEMEAIENSVQSVSTASTPSKRFAVLKVNQSSRFFATNPSANSLVPYDASAVRLGGNEFLLWFEGISRERPTVTKAYPGPTHIAKLWDSGEPPLTDDELLQDLLNLSGANWRGFNARSVPISVYYCNLVADLVHDFQENGLPMPAVEKLPWFL